MAKEKERITARILYVEQGKPANEIADLLNITEKTVSAWVQKYGWKAARTAKITGRDNRVGNIRQIIDGFAEDRLSLQAELSDLVGSGGDKERQKNIRVEMAKIDFGVANWNKTLENVDKTSRISLETYFYVMDKVFKGLQFFDTKLYMATVPFQEQHINEISTELG